MADLLASSFTKPLTFKRGDQVLGKVVSVTSHDYIVELGAKAEGVLSKREIKEELKPGDKVEAFVVAPEGDSGQVILSTQRQVLGSKRVIEQGKRWQKFFQAMERKTLFTGKLTEVNKGGVVIEVDGTRGFLPSSHLSLGSMTSAKDLSAMEELTGRELTVSVIEVEPKNNRLIFTAPVKVDDQVLAKLQSYQVGDQVKAKIAAILPFGLYTFVEGAENPIEGVIYAQEVSWDSNPQGGELKGQYKLGEVLESQIIGKDEALGRLLLSLKRLSEDPFEKMVEKFMPDDVVKGTVVETSQNGVVVKLEDGVEAILPNSKLEPGVEYQPGQTSNFLVDSIDKNKRKINLAPFITSTKGLIYK